MEKQLEQQNEWLWYEKLNSYFPDHEMKDRRQLSALLENSEYYKKESTDEYVLLYAEFPDFIFMDYLWVNPESRGQGIGGKIISRMKEKEKLIILEAEPKDINESDTVKRLRFYDKHGFCHADRIEYVREDEEGSLYEMNILYWAPEGCHQKVVLPKMRKAFEEVHAFEAEKYYDHDIGDPEDVLEWKK